MMTEMLQSVTADRFDVFPHLLSLLIAYALAIPIGWDREREDRSAGLRTFPLVAIASCGFIRTAETALGTGDELVSVMEGVITGIGFIGGGAILQMKTSVRGTATAASLWATGAIGVAVGMGQIDIAVIISVMVFISFKVLGRLKGTAAIGSVDDPDKSEEPGRGEDDGREGSSGQGSPGQG